MQDQRNALISLHTTEIWRPARFKNKRHRFVIPSPNFSAAQNGVTKAQLSLKNRRMKYVLESIIACQEVRKFTYRIANIRKCVEELILGRFKKMVTDDEDQ
ncbi:hypothetical protein TNIN_367341 [Trichonephila inaurata madagascariensis]|uniref:Uncharacterized protein n=1 Tax=Trichonephila inaurata madagascariensis TaxID=2747483 RepID=A0A8X6X8X6_9ARAC|nr:hypothetical protein TNIN_367341 [Trichonephila inaurata madagascariensis]